MLNYKFQDAGNLKLQLSNDLISKDELNKKDDLLKSKDELIKTEKEKSHKIIEGNNIIMKSKNETQKKNIRRIKSIKSNN